MEMSKSRLFVGAVIFGFIAMAIAVVWGVTVEHVPHVSVLLQSILIACMLVLMVLVVRYLGARAAGSMIASRNRFEERSRIDAGKRK